MLLFHNIVPTVFIFFITRRAYTQRIIFKTVIYSFYCERQMVNIYGEYNAYSGAKTVGRKTQIMNSNDVLEKYVLAIYFYFITLSFVYGINRKGES